MFYLVNVPSTNLNRAAPGTPAEIACWRASRPGSVIGHRQGVVARWLAGLHFVPDVMKESRPVGRCGLFGDRFFIAEAE
jgi:hypothetical protein